MASRLLASRTVRQYISTISSHQICDNVLQSPRKLIGDLCSSEHTRGVRSGPSFHSVSSPPKSHRKGFPEAVLWELSLFTEGHRKKEIVSDGERCPRDRHRTWWRKVGSVLGSLLEGLPGRKRRNLRDERSDWSTGSVTIWLDGNGGRKANKVDQALRP